MSLPDSSHMSEEEQSPGKDTPSSPDRSLNQNPHISTRSQDTGDNAHRVLGRPYINIRDWALLQSRLADYAAYASALEESLSQLDLDQSSNAGIKGYFEEIIEIFTDTIKIARFHENSYAHSVLRNDAYASFRMYAQGSPSQEVYNKEYTRTLYGVTDQFQRSFLEDAEAERQDNLASLFHDYITTLCCFYCNKLLNLVDQGCRLEGTKEMSTFEIASRLHNELTQAGYLDEIFVIRITIIQTCRNIFSSLVHDKHATLEFVSNAFECLKELDAVSQVDAHQHFSVLIGSQLWELGVEASEHGDNKAAVDLLQKGLEVDPENTSTLNSLGFIYHSIGDNKSALECFDKAIEIAPDDGLILKNRGMIKVALKDFDSALIDLDKAVYLSPDLWTAAWYRSIAHEELGQYEQAIECLSEYLNRHPDSHQIYERRARVYWGKSIQDETLEADSNLDALQDIASAIEIEPESIEYRITAGHIYDSFSEYVKGIDFYSQALAIDPTSVEALFSRAKNYACVEEIESHLQLALTDLDKASEFDPDNREIIGYRCQVKADLGDFEGALADCDLLDSCLGSGSEAIGNSLDFYADLQRIRILEKKANHHLSCNDLQSALISISKAIETYESPSMFRKRASVYEQLGDSESQSADLRRAEVLDAHTKS